MAASAAFFVVLSACAAPKSLTLASPSPTPVPTEPLLLGSALFHQGEVGITYGPVALSATGGLAPYKWSLFSGDLPAGLTIGPDGALSGTPTAAGNYDFWIQVSDSGDSRQTIEAKFIVWPALSASLIPSCAQYCNVELGCVDVCGPFGTQSGGVAPYTYAVTQGTLPAGTSVAGLSLHGTFKGSSGWLQFTVQVTDAMGATASVSPKFWMYDHISLASGTCIGGFNTGCQTQLPWSGGPSGDTATVAISVIGKYCNSTACWPAGPPPSGYVLTVSGGSVLVSIPKGLMSGYYAVWTLALTDASPCRPSSHCQTQGTVTINVAGG